jgi:branched-subunit amino acid aminotransferase/4-amino-4-deoxychorismate lyase
LLTALKPGKVWSAFVLPTISNLPLEATVSNTSARTPHSLVWTHDRGIIPFKEVQRLPWCHSDDYGGAVFEGVGAWWSQSKGAWNARALWYHIDRFILSIRTVLGVDLRPCRQEMFNAWCELLARNGVPGQNSYSRPRAWNNNSKRGVGELVDLAAHMFTQEMTTYLALRDGQFGATLWWDQLLVRSHPWSVVKWEGNYGEAAVRKRLCHPGHPDPIPAHEVVTLSPHQLLAAASDWREARWSETSGSRIVVRHKQGIATSSSVHQALDSVTLRVIKVICQCKHVPFVERDLTMGQLVQSPGCALIGSWSEMALVERLLIGQDPRIVLTDNQQRYPPCKLVGHEPREYACTFSEAPDPLLLDLQHEYTAFLRGESTLGLPEHLSVWVEPKPVM